MNVVALDLSLTATGVADLSGTLTITTTLKGPARLAHLRDLVMGFALGADVVLIEGYAFGRPHQATALGELGGVVKVALFEAGVPVVLVPPKSLKTFATGKGNAGKEEVLTSAVRRLGYDGHSTDEADALWLWALGKARAGEPVVELPLTHLRALHTVVWPFDVAEPA